MDAKGWPVCSACPLGKIKDTTNRCSAVILRIPYGGICSNVPGAGCAARCGLYADNGTVSACSVLRSPGNSHYLQLESNGTLVLYKSNPKTKVWASKNTCAPPFMALPLFVLNRDGSWTVWAAQQLNTTTGKPIFKTCATHTANTSTGIYFWRPELAGFGNAPYTAHVRDDGSWVVLNKRAAAVWASYSAGPLTAPPNCAPNTTRAQGCKARCGLWHNPLASGDDGCNRLWSASRKTSLSLEGSVASGSIVLRNASGSIRFTATAPGFDLRLIAERGGTWTAYVINAFGQALVSRSSRNPNGVTGLSRYYAVNAGGANSPFSLHVVDTAGGNAVLLNKYGKAAWASYDVQQPYIYSIASGPYAERTFVIVHDPINNLFRIKCWGQNFGGSCGQPLQNSANFDAWQFIGDNMTEMGAALPYIDMGTDVNRQYPLSIKAVSAGEWHSCAVTTSGLLKCWGEGENNKLGYGNSTTYIGYNPDSLGDALPPVEVNFAYPGGVQVSSLAVGREHTCVVVQPNAYNGSVPAPRLRCWGDTYYGQAGPPNSVCDGYGPTPCVANVASQPYVDLGTGITQINGVFAGRDRTCVIVNGNRIKCIGRNTYGELGYGDTKTRGLNASTLGNNLPYVNLGSPVWKVVKLAVGSFHTCALYTEAAGGAQQVKCWGKNEYGQAALGSAASAGATPGSMGDALRPVFLFGADLFADICAGEEHTCVIGRNRASTAVDQVYCWGNWEMLGLGGMVDPETDPSPNVGDQDGDVIVATPLGTNLIPLKLACGQWHTCVQTRNTTDRSVQVKCFGGSGQSGQGLEWYGSIVGNTAWNSGDNNPFTNVGV
ncbi:hypothetical protein HYH03_004238 [Edaphochlamys debaryana]|uniref:Bulb-type lectin domain-containing protein n=1 Tax=Edaphochlamys debaryana TaxID=47281 RepID=A0A836C3R9_9CHLO|nr:hypothetical protein HYH03_004238 [Edaphochlamys debaryana]|eukprot:KAG2497979.1 hypothetical protein HYH03_004238 [Edaphochlamys debaryana]